MPPTIRSYARFRVWVITIVLSGAFGGSYAALANETAWFYILRGAAYGMAIGGSAMAFQIYYVDGQPGVWLRRAPFLSSLALRTGFLVLIMFTAIVVCRLALPHDEPLEERFAAAGLLRDLGASTFIGALLMFFIQMRRVIGPRVLANVLLGRYYQPVREERVFLFYDMADSTALSQRLGDVGVEELVARVFFDLDTVVAAHGGEIHRYIGDEVVVTWPLAEVADDARCLACVFAMNEAIAARADGYRDRYGAVPVFRAGLHGGPVVASQVGDSKQEIVYFGDTINTAARLQAECKRLGLPLLVSGELLAALRMPRDVHCKHVGDVRLRGRAGETALYTVMRTAEAA